jgi:signal transduction histidine kinase
MQEVYDQHVSVAVENECDQVLDSHTTQILFSIAAECVHNARKHAQASQIDIHIGIRQGMFVVGIRDNGRGFDVDRALAEARQREGHLGLLTLYERVALIDGVLKIASVIDQGTRITIAIPLDSLAHRKNEELRPHPAGEPRSPYTRS